MGVVKGKAKKGAVTRPLSPADQSDAAALEASIGMMIGVLEAWDYSRPLASLNRADLGKLATAAISGFVIAKQSEDVSGAWWDDLISDAAFAD